MTHPSNPPPGPVSESAAGDEALPLNSPCPSNPDGLDCWHECAKFGWRCVYCDAVLLPEHCNGCGRFMAAADLNNGESRCENCR